MMKPIDDPGPIHAERMTKQGQDALRRQRQRDGHGHVNGFCLKCVEHGKSTAPALDAERLAMALCGRHGYVWSGEGPDERDSWRKEAAAIAAEYAKEK